MKIQMFKVTLLLGMLICGFGINAQIINTEGEIQSGKDTTNFHDKPSMHVHEETKVISEKPITRHSGADANVSGSKGQMQAMDSSKEASNSTSGSDTAGAITNAGGNEGSVGYLIQVANVEGAGKNTLYTALTIFGIGALIGLFLITMIFRDRKAPVWLALLHGALGIIGIGILIAYSMTYPGPVIAIVIFAVAATGGIIIFIKDVRQKEVPKWLASIHGLIAAAGIVCLVVFALCR